MNHRVHTAILLVILLAIMSALYVFNRISTAPLEPEPESPTSFGGTVPPEIVRGDTTKKQVILTFDAGSGDASALQILAALEKHGVKGTFFMTGKWAIQHPELAKRIAAGGHEVFNHSYSHPHLPELTDEQISNELIHADVALMSVTGSSTKPYFRPPYGDRDERVLKVAAEAGFQSVYWTIDAKDWMETEGMTAGEVKETILSNLNPGEIFLIHVGDTITGSILDDVLTQIEQRGYKAVSLTQGI